MLNDYTKRNSLIFNKAINAFPHNIQVLVEQNTAS